MNNYPRKVRIASAENRENDASNFVIPHYLTTINK